MSRFYCRAIINAIACYGNNLVKGTEPTEALKKEIQDYVKKNTAPYKYPRIVVFRDELPKTISGKIQRNKL